MSRNSSLVALMKIAIFISLSLCLGYLIGGLNAIHVAKALAEGNSTSLADISRRLENGFSTLESLESLPSFFSSELIRFGAGPKSPLK